MITHDNAYKHLFSHPQAVQDLLRGFVHEDWVAQLDYSTLEKVGGSYVADDLRDREDDIVWRIRMRNTAGSQAGEWLYVYLLLEFQSSNDAHMAVRILTYVGLLYQDLIKSGYTRNGTGRLPAVFPLVLYNGERPWSAAREVEELIEQGPPGLMAYRPRLRYFVLDEGRVSEQSLQQQDNAIASVVRIERSASPQDIRQVVGQLVQTLKAPHNRELRRALTVWISRVVLRRFSPQSAIPELQDLPEVHDMIGERIDSWGEQLRQQALQQGIEQGIEQGLGLGQAQALRRLLARRFGPLPAQLEAQIQGASLPQIEQWFDRAMDAADLAGVFGGH